LRQEEGQEIEDNRISQPYYFEFKVDLEGPEMKIGL
jgi:hypothetical protein